MKSGAVAVIVSAFCVLLASCGSLKPWDSAARACYDLAPNHKIECLSRLARDNKNPKYCDYIMEEGFRVTCKTDLAKASCDPLVCESINAYWKRPYCQEEVEKARARGRCP